MNGNANAYNGREMVNNISKTCRVFLSIVAALALKATTTLSFATELTSTIELTNSTTNLLPARSLKGNDDQLCVIGCAPYVRWDRGGKDKYTALVKDLADSCDVIVHVGDTKAGPEPCTDDSTTRAIKVLRDAAKARGRVALYAPGDNEINDCFRIAAKKRNGVPQPSGTHVKAKDARAAIIRELDAGDKDLTGKHDVRRHVNRDDGSCDFDRYYRASNYAVVILEIVGSQYYLQDERDRYPGQPKVDPAFDRMDMYLNAKSCAVRWIQKSAERARQAGLRAVFFVGHASFMDSIGDKAIGTGGIGQTWGNGKFQQRTGLRSPYDPLANAFRDIVKDSRYKDMMFYLVHSDSHRSKTMRLFPSLFYPKSYQNFMSHQIEGYTRGVTMYSRITVSDDPKVLQPVTIKEEWSKRAMETSPQGHTLVFY